MIFVDRTPTPPHLDLDDLDSAASEELADALEHVRTHNTKPPSSTFKAYSHLSVRDALRDLFHNKCAYCESRMAGSQDTDIEHFRPKGAVTEAESAGVNHPGYWWLAMDWTNLVLSCSHCNQLRRQIIFTPGMTEDEIRALIDSNATVSVGKKNAFPTVDNHWVTDRTGDVMAEEQPLLIDPTRDQPEEHLEWVLDEVFSTVRAKDDSPMGKASIDVYGLNRRRLSEDRLVVLSALRNLGNRVKAALGRINEAATDAEANAHNIAMDEHLDGLEDRCKDGEPFSALSRAFLEELITEIEAMA